MQGRLANLAQPHYSVDQRSGDTFSHETGLDYNVFGLLSFFKYVQTWKNLPS